jgi:dUTP pyrophosphatase
MKIKVWTDFKHEHGLPAYETLHASGMDIRANEKVLLQPKETKLIPTGIYMSIPVGFEIQVRPRSGLSLKTKFRIPNSPGTVDADYRGELCVISENTHGSVDMNITLGERIGQIVLCPIIQFEWDPVEFKDDLGTTDRGIGGFGSTGAN